MEDTRKQRLWRLNAELDLERQTFISHWRDLADYIRPRRARFLITDANKGDRKSTKIVDSTATMASRTLSAGMMSGLTSPSRPWFKLKTPDPDLDNYKTVKDWLYIVEDRIHTVFNRSNLYNALPNAYQDLGDFGTGPVYMQEDYDGDVLCFQTFPIGSYKISSSGKGVVDIFSREFRMTVRQIVETFGRKKDKSGAIDWSNISNTVRTMWERNITEQWIDVIHTIYPNENYEYGSKNNKNFKYASCYFEAGSGSFSSTNYLNSAYQDDLFLKESGYNFFPVLAPRWTVSGEDIYGTDCPGMTALGDIKALQVLQKRKSQAIEKIVNPPMIATGASAASTLSILPGFVSYIADPSGGGGFKPAHEINFRIQECIVDIQEHQNRISKAYYEDLFLMLANSDRRQITAREIDERHEEKLLAIGPVLEQLNQDLLDPLIDNSFQIMVEAGLIPTPPEELQGTTLKVEYISSMAQMQKTVGIGSLERFIGFAGNLGSVKPEVWDNIDIDELLKVYGDFVSITPTILKDIKEVQQIRAQRDQAQQAQAMQQQAMALRDAASGAKDLSESESNEDNLLGQILQ